MAGNLEKSPATSKFDLLAEHLNIWEIVFANIFALPILSHRMPPAIIPPLIVVPKEKKKTKKRLCFLFKRIRSTCYLAIL
jgi:hypothetical protein